MMIKKLRIERLHKLDIHHEDKDLAGLFTHEGDLRFFMLKQSILKVCLKAENDFPPSAK